MSLASSDVDTVAVEEVSLQPKYAQPMTSAAVATMKPFIGQIKSVSDRFAAAADTAHHALTDEEVSVWT